MPWLLAGLAVCVACGGPSTARKNYAPAAPVKPPEEEKPRRILNSLPIRVHAEEAYRAAHVDWRSDFAARVRRANDILSPRFGVELEIESLHEWERGAESGDIGSVLGELETLDSGKGVVWVIGLLSGLPVFEPSLDHLGMARIFGKHLILRGVDDPKELEVFLTMPKKPGEEEPSEIYSERIRHRETVTLLHELGHTLGAIHTRDPRSFMHPVWDQAAADYDSPNATLIQLSLRHMLLARARKDQPPESFADVIAQLEASDGTDWDPADRARVIATLKQYRPPRERSAVESPRPALPKEEAEIYGRAITLANAGKPKEALEAVEPLLKSRAEDPMVQSLGCALSTAAHPAAPKAHQACATAARLAPTDPRPELHLAYGLIEAKDPVNARIALGYAQQRLEKTGDDPESWAYLAQLYQRVSLLTFSEEAAARAGELGKNTLDWLAKARRFHALPKKAARFRIRPEDEAEYIAKSTEARRHLDAGDVRAAMRIAEAGLRRFPDAPAFHTRICAAQLRTMNKSAADKACRRAITGYEEAPEPHFLLGVIASLSGRYQDAIQYLERAIALDPEAQPAWRALAQQYRRSGNKAAVERLRAEFASRFGSPLERR